MQYIERTDKSEKELRDLKRENEQLRDDIRDLQRQIESQRESILAKRDDDAGYRDKMTQKNKLLATALEENQVGCMELNLSKIVVETISSKKCFPLSYRTDTILLAVSSSYILSIRVSCIYR